MAHLIYFARVEDRVLTDEHNNVLRSEDREHFEKYLIHGKGMAPDSFEIDSRPATQTESFQKLIDLAFASIKSTSFLGGSIADTEFRPAEIHNPSFVALFKYLHEECLKPKAPEILVEVKGGNVNDIYASTNYGDLSVTMRDFDNIRCGDTDPIGEDEKPEDHGYPEHVY